MTETQLLTPEKLGARLAEWFYEGEKLRVAYVVIHPVLYTSVTDMIAVMQVSNKFFNAEWSLPLHVWQTTALPAYEGAFFESRDEVTPFLENLGHHKAIGGYQKWVEYLDYLAQTDSRSF